MFGIIALLLAATDCSTSLPTHTAKIGIKCINTNPSNSIIGFVHPKMNYENLSQHLAKQNIIIYSQVPGIKNSFRVATMSVVFDKHFDKIIEAFYETCVC